MTLFEIDSQFRERAAIWRVFSLLPLFASLAEGRIYKWFAVNIPMDLGTGGSFTSDIDILACLHDHPRSKGKLFPTWEVKVSLLCRDGTARSLKAGKTARTITQLQAYRNFGSPIVFLLDIFLCEAGFMDQNTFPPPCLDSVAKLKLPELMRHHFGYQVLPFEHGKDSEGDIGLRAIGNPGNPYRTIFNILPPAISAPAEPFTRLTQHLDDFFDQATVHDKTKRQIVFCKGCRKLGLINMKNDYDCPNCQADLISQS